MLPIYIKFLEIRIVLMLYWFNTLNYTLMHNKANHIYVEIDYLELLLMFLILFYSTVIGVSTA